ncbi:MAG: glutamate synthase-related protein, partial [Kiloniellales bacterium]
MVTLDLAEIPVREANERIREAGAQGEDVEVLNPDARHHIGVGLTHDITVRVRGSAGYFCAGLTDGPRFEVDNNAGWGLADNMYQGSVVVGGNAGAIAGVAIRGAEVVVKGNLGSRAGQVMKAGTLACAGNANFMAGYMMYGGRIIILGESGERLGEDMTGGEIYLGGELNSLGSDAMVTDISRDEIDAIMEFLDRYEIPFKGSLQKVINAGKNLRYGTAEPTVRSLPFFTFSDNCDYWNKKIQEDIYVKSQIGRYRVRGYGGARAVPHLTDITFRKDLTRAGEVDDPVSKVKMRTLVGGKNGAKALDISMPVMIAPMSYGALSRSAKQAVAIASGMSDIAENTG